MLETRKRRRWSSRVFISTDQFWRSETMSNFSASQIFEKELHFSNDGTDFSDLRTLAPEFFKHYCGFLVFSNVFLSRSKPQKERGIDTTLLAQKRCVRDLRQSQSKPSFAEVVEHQGGHYIPVTSDVRTRTRQVLATAPVFPQHGFGYHSPLARWSWTVQGQINIVHWRNHTLVFHQNFLILCSARIDPCLVKSFGRQQNSLLTPILFKEQKRRGKYREFCLATLLSAAVPAIPASVYTHVTTLLRSRRETSTCESWGKRGCFWTRITESSPLPPIRFWCFLSSIFRCRGILIPLPIARSAPPPPHRAVCFIFSSLSEWPAPPRALVSHVRFAHNSASGPCALFIGGWQMFTAKKGVWLQEPSREKIYKQYQDQNFVKQSLYVLWNSSVLNSIQSKTKIQPLAIYLNTP